jgi:hypothetical protein
MAENDFPTIRNLRDQLTVLVENGLGGLPVHIVVAPDSSIQALARFEGGAEGKPAIMIEFPIDGRPLGIAFITTDRFTAGGGMPSLRRQ